MKAIIKKIGILGIAMVLMLSNMLMVSASDNDAERIQTIYAGTTSGAITENGDLYTWGKNFRGEIGNGTTNEQLTPVKILSNVKTVDFGDFYGGAITEDGSLYMWGTNQYGEIGNGTTKNQLTPVKILSNVKAVCFHNSHNAAITEDGSLYMWGWNLHGEIGNGKTEDIQLTPVKVLSDVVSVQMSSYYSAAITEDGSLYTWGCNLNGEIGNGKKEYSQSTPVKVLSNVVSFQEVDSYCGALTEDGSLYMWGCNIFGRIGNGTRNDQLIPLKILSNVVSVQLEGDYCGAITEDGRLYMWGCNDWGQIGNGTADLEKPQLTPLKVLSNVVSVQLKNNQSAAITEDGSLYTWGCNLHGEIGNGKKEYSQSLPVKVLSNVVSVQLEGDYCGAITEDGSLYMWGYNGDGQIGNGTSNYQEPQLTPKKVLSNVIDVSITRGGSLALRGDGSLYMWGRIGGNGTTAKQLVPVKILNNVRYRKQIPSCVQRISGKDRYTTAFEVSDKYKEVLGVEKFDAVVVATGKNFADALTGSYLAVEKNAPILLTNAKEENIDRLHEYIENNIVEGGTIYILGGESAVPEEVESIAGYDVVRLWGESRYETNLAILEEAEIQGDSIIVATGKNFADALAASATKLPILLLKPNSTLNDAQKEILANMNKIYIVGGEGAVSNAYEEELSTYGIVERVYGASRYDTSVSIANTFFDSIDTAVIASGKNFPDGLCGGILATALNAPLVLTKDGGTNIASDYLEKSEVTSGYILGGKGALNDNTVINMFDFIQ